METTMVATVGELLGLRRGRGASLDFAGAVERGLPVAALERLKVALGLADAELAVLLGTSAKTLSRLRTSRRSLTLVEGDRLYRLVRLAALAGAVLEDDEAVRQWFVAPQPGLGQRTPLALAATEAGAREVEALLTRLEHGVLA